MVALIEKREVPLGHLVATPGAIKAIHESGQTALEFLQRHRYGDWGNLCQEDWALNDLAIERGDRILSAYKTSLGTKLWIITEADRNSTCILLPEEY